MTETIKDETTQFFRSPLKMKWLTVFLSKVYNKHHMAASDTQENTEEIDSITLLAT